MPSVQDTVQAKLKWAKENPSLCFFPYNNIDLRLPSAESDKDKIRVSCCCNLDSPPVVDNLSHDPFAAMKVSMNADKLPINCSKCKFEEGTSGTSERIRDILGKNIEELELFKRTREVTSFELRMLTSNICNLSCRSCEPYSSSTYAKIILNNELDHLNVDITELDQYWNLIIGIIQDKVDTCDNFYLHFMGGEPLLHKGNRKVLDWIINNRLNDKVSIRITTSMNIAVDDDFLRKLNAFKGTDFILSIDSVNENYHYLRWPAKFEKTINNLSNLIEGKKTLDSAAYFNYILSPVFSLNNLFYLKDYLDFWYNWQNEKNLSLFFCNTNVLYRTRHLDIQALPTKYKSVLIGIIEESLTHPILTKYSATMAHLYNFLVSSKLELEGWAEDLDLWDKFLAHTAEFDTRTNTSFEHYNKNLYNVLTTDDKLLFAEKLKNVNKTQKMNSKFY